MLVLVGSIRVPIITTILDLIANEMIVNKYMKKKAPEMGALLFEVSIPDTWSIQDTYANAISTTSS